MNYRMIDTLVALHIQEIRRQAARQSAHRRAPRLIASADGLAGLGSEPRSRHPAALENGPALRHPAGLRNRIGFALIEAGLRLSVPASGREPSPSPE